MPDVPATDTQDATTDDGATTPPPAPEADPAGADALGDAGKKALDTMKAQRNAERDRRKALEAELAELKTPKGDDAQSADAIRATVQQEADAKANARIVRAEIRAAAAGKLADPADALRYIDAAKFDVSADGSVDADEIGEAINELITTKPYLGAATAPRFQGTGDGGARKAQSGPTQLTQSDIDGMSAAQIVAAKKEGRLKTLLGGKD